jgi:hypothetical protein
LIKLRNPWGFGEWEGGFSDNSDERKEYEMEIKEAFKMDHEDVEINSQDGTFYMKVEDWYERFTSLFIAANFPPSWTGKRTKGEWGGDSGGNREMGTWTTNPRVKLMITDSSNDNSSDHRQVFVGIYIRDSRLLLGADYYKDPLYATPLAFDIVTEEELLSANQANSTNIKYGWLDLSTSSTDGPQPAVSQPPYMFGTTQVEVYLKVNTVYYIVPSLYKRKQAGEYYLHVFAESDFELGGSAMKFNPGLKVRIDTHIFIYVCMYLCT